MGAALPSPDPDHAGEGGQGWRPTYRVAGCHQRRCRQHRWPPPMPPEATAVRVHPGDKREASLGCRWHAGHPAKAGPARNGCCGWVRSLRLWRGGSFLDGLGPQLVHHAESLVVAVDGPTSPTPCALSRQFIRTGHPVIGSQLPVTSNPYWRKASGTVSGAELRRRQPRPARRCAVNRATRSSLELLGEQPVRRRCAHGGDRQRH